MYNKMHFIQLQSLAKSASPLSLKKNYEHGPHWPLLALTHVRGFYPAYTIGTVLYSTSRATDARSRVYYCAKINGTRPHYIEIHGLDRLIIALLNIINRLQIGAMIHPTRSCG
jgi:hypothetical protein